VIELKFSEGPKQEFIGYLRDPNPGGFYNLWGSYEDLLQAASDFNAALKKAETVDKYAIRPLSAKEMSALMLEENKGASAEQDGRLREAWEHYLTAFRTLPKRPPPDLDQRLRELIIKLVRRLDPPPAIPEEARMRAGLVSVALELAKKDPSQLDAGIDEWQEALRVAPWWPEGNFNVGLMLEQRERFEEAARFLRLYLLAMPNASDRDAVQQKIYKLEYEAKAQSK